MNGLYSVWMGCAFAVLLGVSCRKHNTIAAGLPANPDSAVETKPPVLTAVSSPIDSVMGGYYVAKPAYYDYTAKSYPLLVFIPGAGQYGNGGSDLSLLLNDGVAKLVANKQFPAAFSVGGKTFSFIVFTPQLFSYPTDAQLLDILVYARRHFRVDSTRIYVSGLSVGGTMACTMAGEYFTQIAAVVPISGEDNTYDICRSLAVNDMPVWVFHNQNDPKIPVSQATDFVSRINAYSPTTPPRLTLFPDYSHDAWTQALDPGYREQGMNIYEWMLHYTR